MSTTRRPRRQSVDNETARRQILAGAARLFMERGFHATSVRELGEELDISQSSLYYHAKNKAQILVDLNDEFMSGLVAAMEEIAERDDDALTKLDLVVHELLQVVAQHQAVVTVVLHERRSLPVEAAAAVQAQRDRVDTLIDQILEQGIADGTIREVSVPLVRLALTGMTNWAYTWYHADGSLTADEIADGFIEILRNGIAA
jgi:TetR/AcrR family transcriptional regulator, cholesterol catabolism regulator